LTVTDLVADPGGSLSLVEIGSEPNPRTFRCYPTYLIFYANNDVSQQMVMNVNK